MQESSFRAYLQATQAENTVLVAGYGSLLSQCSRQSYSEIYAPTLPVLVHTWERAWITRAWHEKQTYVGAVPNASAKLNAQLIPMQFSEEFSARERDYRFVKLNPDTIEFAGGADLSALMQHTPIYICESTDIYHSDAEHPVNLSYVATCLKGCYEIDGMREMQKFIQHTGGWDTSYFNNDFQEKRYPRAAETDDDFNQLVLDLLKDRNISV